MCDKAKLVSRLLAAKDTPFLTEDTERLNEMTERQLTVLANGFDPGDEDDDKDETGGEAEPKVLSEKEWLDRAPANVRSLVQRAENEEKARRTGLITALAGAQKRKDEKALSAMSTEDLQDLYAIMGLGEPERDYSGVGLPQEPTALATNDAPDPWSMDKAGSARSN